MNVSKLRVVLASLIATSALWSGCGSKPGNPQAAPATVTGVTIETVHLQNLPVEYSAVGTIRSATSSVLGAQIGGTVREIRVKPGDRVRRGEVLAELDDRTPRAQLASADAGVDASKAGEEEGANALQAATAQRKLAEVTYHRYQELLGKNSVTRQEFDGAEAAYKSAVANEAAAAARKQQMQAESRAAQSQRESAQTMFSYSRIVSPIDGVVTAKLVDAGTLVIPGTPLFTVEDPAHYRLEASVPEDLLPKIQAGQQVQVTTGQGQFPGRVVEVVPAADPGSRTFVVKVALPAACACRSGEYGTAAFATGELKALAVPRSAVIERGQLEGVYVVDSRSLAEYRLVKTGKILGDRVEILSGLSDGEQIATSQPDRLSDGVRVEAP
ncbi:MAG TPA: efflux RND transporter periplasmic adaptor subunit [Terriglobia bacterium]|nr:efflux RND transporter periplasmic adaptor subunit [Terriglobia bacterium]